MPVLALIGRPNVGKSTLFNRLTRSREALVSNYYGLTRDRKYGRVLIAGHYFLLIDTGGLTGSGDGIEEVMAEQSRAAIDEADAILFMVDAASGFSATDQAIADMLRRTDKPIWLVANKTDGQNTDIVLAELYCLGFGDPHPIAASHGRGVNALTDLILAEFNLTDCDPNDPSGMTDDAQGIKIGIVGRPNVGKSTLVNCMLGEDRVVVFDRPGTTRDSVYIPFERHDETYTLIDTAGVRRRGRVNEAIEKFSIVKTLEAIADSHVVILVIDAQEGLVEQDLHLLGIVIDMGKAVVVVVNKWDNLDSNLREYVRITLKRRLKFVSWAKIHYVSALHGTGVGNMYPLVKQAYRAATTKFSTNEVTRILEDAVEDHPPPLVRGRRVKLRYAHQGGINPPRIIVHGNQTNEVPEAYRRYLENTYRKVLQITGSPVKIEFKSSDNPYAGKRNVLTGRQIKKKRRMMQFVKKKY